MEIDKLIEEKPNANLDPIKESVSSKINFKSFASLLEKIVKLDETSSSSRTGIGKNLEKKRILQKFIEAWRETAKNDTKVDDNFYPSMRLLLPGDDRRVYGLKEVKLAKYLIEALCIAPKSDDALKLLNYRAPSNVKSDGDFASVAYFVLKNRCREDLTLSIHEVNHHLDIISINNTKGKQGQKEVNNSIKHLLVNLSAVQLKWLIRIMLKDLKIGIKEAVILDSFHPDAMDLYNFTSSLEKVCLILNDPNKRYHEVGISLFSPCRPMLGEKAKPNKIEQLLNGREFYIETKFDGERFQLHKSDDKFVYYSRNGHDYTETLGSDIYTGTLTPFIFDSFFKDVKNLILDGEMCAYNLNNKILLSKSDDIDVKSNKQFENIQTCFCVFDILLYNDTVLTNKPLKERIEYIKKSFREIEGRIIYSNRIVAKSNQQVVDALNNAIDSRLEGIVVKDPESVYKPSIRGGGWFKVKPDYMIGLNDDLDLIVIGGYYGSGRRSGLISHFLLAVAVDDDLKEQNKKLKNNDEDDLDLEGNESEKNFFNPKKFYSFCKIGSGYSIKELQEFNQKLENKWIEFDKKNPPKHLELSYEKPEVWIEPKNSFVVQVKAVEICSSDKYKTGCTLRFPRLEKFRPDKNWFECMRLSELNSLKEKNEGKLAAKHLNLDDLEDENDQDGFKFDDEDGAPSKKKKKITKIGKKATVGACYRGIDASIIDKIGNVFDNKEICILIEDDSQKKTNLEKGLAELGGIPVQNPGKETYCIVASRLTHRIKSYISKDSYDIVKVDWLIRCIKGQKMHNWRPKDMIHSKLETKNMFKKLYDSFGDSYFENSSVEGLKELFNSDGFINKEYKPKMDQEFKLNLREKIAYLENKYFSDRSAKFGLFRIHVFYLDMYEIIGDSSSKILKDDFLELVELKIRWHGGIVVNKINQNTTHCVLIKSDQARLEEFKKLNRSRERKFRIISTDWINDCIKSHKIKDELAYVL